MRTADAVLFLHILIRSGKNTFVKVGECMLKSEKYLKNFFPYALSAFLIGLVGGFASVLGPAFVKDIGIGYNNTAWTALATAMSSASFAPVLGKLCDIVGRKKSLVAGLLIFTLGNVLTALSESMVVMLPARFIVGIGTAAISPVVMAYIISEFPQDKVSKGFSLYMFVSGFGVIFGPGTGGVIIGRYGWRVMMWICAAISLSVTCFTALVFGKSLREEKRINADYPDISGSIAIILFFSIALCIPSAGQNYGWTSTVSLVIIISAAFAFVFLVYTQKNSSSPVLSVEFMSRKEFILTVAALFLTQGLMQANMTNMIVFVNYSQPENAVISGYAVSVMYAGMSLGSVIIGPLADRFRADNVLTASLLLTAVSCSLLFLFTEDTSLSLLSLSLGLLGFGLGGNATVFMKTALSGMPTRLAGAATGTYGLFRDLAAPLGVSVLVPMFTNDISKLVSMGISPALSAVSAVRKLGRIELIFVFSAILIVRSLRIDKKGGINE